MNMDSVSLPDPESLEESGTPLFSGEFRFCLKHQVSFTWEMYTREY